MAPSYFMTLSKLLMFGFVISGQKKKLINNPYCQTFMETAVYLFIKQFNDSMVCLYVNTVAEIVVQTIFRRVLCYNHSIPLSLCDCVPLCVFLETYTTHPRLINISTQYHRNRGSGYYLMGFLYLYEKVVNFISLYFFNLYSLLCLLHKFNQYSKFK